MTDAERFLKAVFHTVPAGSTVVLGKQVSTQGHNIARAYPRAVPDGVTHASIALQSLLPSQTSRIANWLYGASFVLDDVGETKVNEKTGELFTVPRPTLKPAAVVETKPGSQQWWYSFEEPTADQDFFERAVRGFCLNGLTDPGANNIVRWDRLPGSQPPGKPATARLLYLSPETLYPASELLTQALGLTALPPSKPDAWPSRHRLAGSWTTNCFHGSPPRAASSARLRMRWRCTVHGGRNTAMATQGHATGHAPRVASSGVSSATKATRAATQAFWSF